MLLATQLLTVLKNNDKVWKYLVNYDQESINVYIITKYLFIFIYQVVV